MMDTIRIEKKTNGWVVVDDYGEGTVFINFIEMLNHVASWSNMDNDFTLDNRLVVQNKQENNND